MVSILGSMASDSKFLAASWDHRCWERSYKDSIGTLLSPEFIPWVDAYVLERMGTWMDKKL